MLLLELNRSWHLVLVESVSVELVLVELVLVFAFVLSRPLDLLELDNRGLSLFVLPLDLLELDISVCDLLCILVNGLPVLFKTGRLDRVSCPPQLRVVVNVLLVRGHG